MPEQRETVGQHIARLIGDYIDRKRELFEGAVTADKGEKIREAKAALAAGIDEAIKQFVD